MVIMLRSKAIEIVTIVFIRPKHSHNGDLRWVCARLCLGFSEHPAEWIFVS